jgi:RIO-like serine/threonine protein kinase
MNPVFHKILSNDSKAMLEIELQTIAAKYEFAPKLYEVLSVESKLVLCMERITAPCLADVYGEDPRRIPRYIWQQIRDILQNLYYEEGIEYIDITPYNFIELPDGKVYIIDFGDAYYTSQNGSKEPNNWFLREFLDGEYTWNPDFR